MRGGTGADYALRMLVFTCARASRGGVPGGRSFPGFSKYASTPPAQPPEMWQLALSWLSRTWPSAGARRTGRLSRPPTPEKQHDLLRQRKTERLLFTTRLVSPGCRLLFPASPPLISPRPRTEERAYEPLSVAPYMGIGHTAAQSPTDPESGLVLVLCPLWRNIKPAEPHLELYMAAGQDGAAKESGGSACFTRRLAQQEGRWRLQRL